MFIAVYGTLKQGGYNHDFMKDAKFIKRSRVSKVALWTRGRLPMAVYTALPEDFTWVEIYEVGPETLRRIDSLEGHPSFYMRTPVITDDGDQVEMYLVDDVNPKTHIKVLDGDYDACTLVV